MGILRLKLAIVVMLWGVSLTAIGLQRSPVTTVAPDTAQIITQNRPVPLAPVYLSTGLALATVGVLSGINTSTRFEDWEAATDALLDDVFAAFGGLLSRSSGRVGKLILRSLPASLNARLDSLEASSALFERFLNSPHNRLVGRTNAGKTYLLSALLVTWLERYGETGIVTICDRNFGKPENRDSDDGSEAFDWLGLPVDCIRFRDEDISAALDAELDELEKRIEVARNCAIAKQRIPAFQPRLFVLDELDSTQKILNDGKGPKGEFSKRLQRLTDQANGYRMKVVLCGQKIAVEESGINLATLTSFATALLGTDTQSAKVVSYLVDDTADELAATCAKLINARKRPAIIQLEGEARPRAIAIPDLSEYRKTRIEYLPAIDPIEAQWREVFTEEKRAELVGLAEQLRDGKIKAPRGSGGPVKAFILPALGLKPSDLTRPIWQDFGRPVWEQIKQKVEV